MPGYKSKKSASILLVIMVTAVIIATGLAVATILIVEFKTSILAGDSTTAIYAAESGIEWELYQLRKGAVSAPTFTCQGSICPSFVATVDTSNPSVTKVKSIGTFGRARRALEVSY